MGGTPPPPFTDKIFGKKGVTDKIRKVVFDLLPNMCHELESLEKSED